MWEVRFVFSNSGFSAKGERSKCLLLIRESFLDYFQQQPSPLAHEQTRDPTDTARNLAFHRRMAVRKGNLADVMVNVALVAFHEVSYKSPKESSVVREVIDISFQGVVFSYIERISSNWSETYRGLP